MVIVKSYLKILLAEKEMREHRTISLRKLIEESGASASTVNRLANNTIRRLPLDDLATICTYLECEIGELLRLEKDDR